MDKSYLYTAPTLTDASDIPCKNNNRSKILRFIATWSIFVHLKVGLALEALGLNDLTGKTKPHVPKKKKYIVHLISNQTLNHFVIRKHEHLC